MKELNLKIDTPQLKMGRQKAYSGRLCGLYCRFGKRLLDVVAALAALVILSPLLVLLTILILLQSRGGVFFYHARIGRKMKPFHLIKFRTMTSLEGLWNDHCDTGSSTRVTWIGRFLRKTKFDELPSLVNVLKGDMSLVGSRPEVARYVKVYPEVFQRILEFRPGLTDHASVKYHDEERLLAEQVDPEAFYREVILPDKLALAEQYTQQISFMEDVRIIWRTVKVVFSPKKRTKTKAGDRTSSVNEKSRSDESHPRKWFSLKPYIVNKNIWIMLIGDGLLISAAYCLAYVIRFDGRIPINELQRLADTVWWIVPLKLLFLARYKLYRGMWRYTSLHDLYNLIKANTLGSLLILVILLVFIRFQGYARSVFLIDFVLTFLFVGGFRIGIRTYYDRKKGLDRRMFRNWQHKELKRILIIGGGNAGEKLLREIRDNEKLFYDVVGFVDDDPQKLHKTIHGIRVLGTVGDLAWIAKQQRVSELVIALPSASSTQMRAIVKACKSTGLPFKTVPGMGELLQGKLSISAVREVKYEDLIGRKQAKLNLEEIGRYLSGKRVMVTGGAGSIGSELCRQIAPFKPEELIVVDISETGVYEIVLDLKAAFPGLKVHGILGSVQDDPGMARIFEQMQPEVIFHAAAYKHVSMLENHPWESVYNNVLGTRNVLDLCVRYSVDRCVVVSTDKAVKPTNVMGASKRVIEMLTQSYAALYGARFIVVRFGNVIGSAGSVVPLFRKQIRRGGPVTVTHPEVTRYFMTISEASRLILQAGAMGNGGEIFILKMGIPVKIDDMARDLIRLSGLKPDEDIEIEYIGLKPGEKLYEELITEGEGIRESQFDEIMVLTNGCKPLSLEKIDRNLANLIELAHKGDADGIKRALKQLVPEYTPTV